MIGDRDRPETPQGRNLIRIKPRRARQARDEHDRQRVRHVGTLSAARPADYWLVKKSEVIRLTCCTARAAFRLTLRQSIICCGHPKRVDSTARRRFSSKAEHIAAVF